MSASTHRWKRGDTLPALRRTLSYSDGAAQSLVGAAVKFIMFPGSGGDKDPGASPIVCDVVIIDAAAGIVEFQPNSTETGTIGVYLGEFEAVTAAGKRVTFPNDGYITITIIDDLGDQ